jgi:putative Mg2+ transporter-C (MgtC) family protein
MSADELDILLKVVVAVCLGGMIGIERELARKPAGIRTHMFVAGAATLVMSLSTVLINDFNRTFGNVQSDPVRVIEAIIVGISFIGAGTVLKSEKEHNVYYLTTAASILFAAGIGITVALELFGLAICLTILVILINAAVGGIEQKYLGKGKQETDNVHKSN